MQYSFLKNFIRKKIEKYDDLVIYQAFYFY